MRSRYAMLLFALLGCGSGSTSAECEELQAIGCVPDDGGTPDGGAEPGSSLVVSVDWLADRLGDPSVQPVDTRASGFEASRIPGAIHLRPSALSSTIDGVPSQIVAPAEAELVLREAGLRSDAIAVVYGEPPEYDPSRIVWALRYYGHEDVRYLDGGFDAWVEAQGEVDSGSPTIEPTDYAIAGVREDLRVTGDWILSQLGDPPYDAAQIQIVDARSEGEHANGRIPGVRSVNWTRNLDGGALRPTTELEALYDGLDRARTTVTYCTSGLRGSFDWLTLVALGYEDVRLYDGSWNEWSTGAFPIEQ